MKPSIPILSITMLMYILIPSIPSTARPSHPHAATHPHSPSIPSSSSALTLIPPHPHSIPLSPPHGTRYSSFSNGGLALIPPLSHSALASGFSLPDSIPHATFTYKTIQNLIILPVTINDSIHVNLILDTGCRNLVLFGKRFQNMFNYQNGRKIQFSGLGSGKPIEGRLSLDNAVSINVAVGKQIPIVVVPNKNLFAMYSDVHGVIGYDLLTKFEIELNPVLHRITLRPAATAQLANTYTHVPIRIEDSRPLIDCKVIFSSEYSQLCNLMLDTGSSLGLLLKTSELKQYPFAPQKRILGRGLNGSLSGIRTVTERLQLNGIEMTSLETGIIYSPWHNYASLGMDVLKQYALVLNYCKEYAGFRKL